MSVAPNNALPAVPCIVLDTNVCLDLFLFNDVQCVHLLSALHAGQVLAVTRDDCRDEWRRVLHYPQVPIDDANRQAVSAAFDALVRHLPAENSTAPHDSPLPRCDDPDDQKFLQLALASGARWLISKDNALLKLDQRCRAAGLFRVLLPQQWSLDVA